MINRRITRVVLNTTEITDFLESANAANYVLPLLTTDALYLGYHGKFTARYFQVGVANPNTAELSVQYWDGSNWQDVDDLLDQTSLGGKTLSASGFISW